MTVKYSDAVTEALEKIPDSVKKAFFQTSYWSRTSGFLRCELRSTTKPRTAGRLASTRAGAFTSSSMIFEPFPEGGYHVIVPPLPEIGTFRRSPKDIA